jgi:O-antigen/teichoic acid export membrane protein
MIPQGVRNIIKAFFNGKMDLSYCFNIELAYQICKIFFIYLFIYLRKGILGVMSGLLIAEILSIFVAIYLLFKFAKTRCTSCADRDTLGVNQHSIIKELAIKSLPYWVLGIIGLFATKMDIFCIKFFLSDYTKVAYYDTARSLIDSIGLFLSIATISLWPILSVAAKKNDQNMARQYIGRIIRYGFLFGLPICVWVATNSSVVMSLVFSYKFVSGAGVLAVLAIGRFWIILFSNIINIITMVYGNIWLFVIITISGVPILIFMNWLFIPSLGILGAAIAGMIASIIVIVFLLIYLYNFTLVFRNNMLTINKLTFFRGMAAALVSFGITQAVYLPNSILAFFMKSALFVLAYSYLLFYFKEINQEDKRIIGAIWAKIHGVTRSGN